jgi:cytochrome c peroxidase
MAAYFRDGQAATLDDVIEFYDRGGLSRWGPKEIRPLHVSSEEKQWLKAFLETVTDTAPIFARPP